MALKPDENFVKDCLIKHFGPSVTAWEGEDPPDIYLNINGKTIAVEITRLSPVSFNQDGVAQNRNTQDIFGINLCNELNSKLEGDVPSELDILLTIHIPVKNVKRYKKELHSRLKEKIEEGIKMGDRSDVSIAGAKIRISTIPNREHSQKKIVGLIVNDNSSAHISSNAEIILTERIIDKVKKCSKIQYKGSKWLSLFNDYWLADNKTYSLALKNVSVEHDFEKIFVISDTGQVHCIY